MRRSIENPKEMERDEMKEMKWKDGKMEKWEEMLRDAKRWG